MLNINVEECNSVGWILIAAAAVSPLLLPRKTRRALFPWWCLTGGAMLLSFGGAMGAHSHTLSDALQASATLLGFPGNGFALPWHFEGEISAALSVFAASVNLPDYLPEPLWMPYSWLWTIAPPLRPFRGTARLSVLVALAIALLAGFALKHLLHRRQNSRKLIGTAWMLAFFAAVLVGYVVVPYPTFSIHIPQPISALSREPSNSEVNVGNQLHPIVEIPLDSLPDSLLDQTAYQQPAFDGFLSRTPRSAYSEIENNAFLSLAFSDALASNQITASAAIPAGDRRIQAAIADLYALGLRTVIVKPHQTGTAKAALIDTLLTLFGAAKLPSSNNQAIIYRLQPHQPKQ